MISVHSPGTFSLRVSPHRRIVSLSDLPRYHKCLSCYEKLSAIRAILLKKQSTSGKLGASFRELAVLIRNLEWPMLRRLRPSWIRPPTLYRRFHVLMTRARSSRTSRSSNEACFVASHRGRHAFVKIHPCCLIDRLLLVIIILVAAPILQESEQNCEIYSLLIYQMAWPVAKFVIIDEKKERKKGKVLLKVKKERNLFGEKRS